LLKKHECLIEVKIVYSSYRWQGEVSSKMMQTIAKLRAAAEELGGKIRVRYYSTSSHVHKQDLKFITFFHTPLYFKNRENS